MRNRTLPLFLFAVAGCGGVAMLGGVAPEMVYSVPDANPLTYEQSDSMTLSVDAPGMGALTLRIDKLMMLGMTFAPPASGVRVTTVIERLSARMTNPLSAPITLTESDVQGALILHVSGRGTAEMTEAPAVANVEGPLFSVATLAHELLPRLPPPGTEIGGDWMDTISYSSEDASGSLDVTWIGTSRLVGDTVVDGRRLRLVRTDAEVAIDVAGIVSGMSMTQSMAGPEKGFYLWDRLQGVLYSQEVERNFTGSVRVPIMPGPLGLSAKQRRTMKLIDG